MPQSNEPAIAESDDKTNDTRSTREARLRLNHEILAIIEPHKHSDSKPPFSGTELVVMGEACEASVYINKANILRRICNTFSFYGKKAIEQYAKTQVDCPIQIDEIEEVVEGFSACFGDITVPLGDADEYHPINYEHDHRPEIYIKPHEARLFLRNVLALSREGSFDFMGLPAEIRGIVYDMLFSYPKGRILIDRQYYWLKFHVLQREVDERVENDTWREYFERGYHVEDSLSLKRPETLFALLLANKQIYREVMPVFYAINHFYFKFARRDYSSPLVHCLATSRIQYMTSVSVDLSSIMHDEELWSAYLQDNIRVFLNIKKLKRLQICVSGEERWLRLRDMGLSIFGRERPFGKFEQIPGFRDLARLASRAEHIEFGGGCWKFEAFIKAEVKRSQLRTEEEGGDQVRDKVIED